MNLNDPALRTNGVLTLLKNTDILAVNQDALGVQARKLAVDGQLLPWLVGIEDCRGPISAHSRGLQQQLRGLRSTHSSAVSPTPISG